MEETRYMKTDSKAQFIEDLAATGIIVPDWCGPYYEDCDVLIDWVGEIPGRPLLHANIIVKNEELVLDTGTFTHTWEKFPDTPYRTFAE